MDRLLRGMGRLLRLGRGRPAIGYPEWVARYDTAGAKTRAALSKRLAVLQKPPLFSLLRAAPWPPETVEAIEAQIYPTWELCEDLEAARGQFIIPADGDFELPPHALFRLAEELEAHPDAAVIYSDEDRIDGRGVRSDPRFKPDWNHDLLESCDYLGGLCAWRASLVRDLGGFSALSLAKRVEKSRLRHIPAVLFHRRMESQPEIRRVRFPVPSPAPLVSLIIPTRDGLSLLRACVESIRVRTTYAPYELIVVDNGSAGADTLVYLRELEAAGVAVLRQPGAFNFSRLNNLAARAARGELLGFLNNDLEAIGGGWLEEMVSHAARKEIGAVGAKLLFPDGTIQHAGIILGLGEHRIAGTPHRGLPRDSPGYCGRALAAQDFSAVTAACMVMRKRVFEEVGGFDEANLPVSYNDVDLCLRLGERGYRVLWTPYAELYHKESATRGSDQTPENRARFALEVSYMRKRWGALLETDPYFNPNLSLDSDAFLLATPPRSPRPSQPLYPSP